MFIKLENLPAQEIAKGFHAKIVHTETMSVVHLQVEAGYAIPMHSHSNEQITNILNGELEMTVAGETKICKAGEVVTIPAHVPHSAKAITDCWVIDIFQPVREDFKLGMR